MMDFLYFAGISIFFAAFVAHGIYLLIADNRASSPSTTMIVGKKNAPSLYTLHVVLLGCGWVAQLVYMIVRGVLQGHFPLANQFEFAFFFAWCIITFLGFLLVFSKTKDKKSNFWVLLPAAMFFIYTLFISRRATSLMPVLRSPWLVIHVATAAIAYACLAVAWSYAIRFLWGYKNNYSRDALKKWDKTNERVTKVGYFFLSGAIIFGAIWAKQAWSRFWGWDPKEIWALVTWIIYSIYIHLRLRREWHGLRAAVYTLGAFLVVIFTFIGVNYIFTGLHSY